jgi:hypothetical protein
MPEGSEPDSKAKGDAAAKAFEQAYKETHPNGPYPPVELRRKEE